MSRPREINLSSSNIPENKSNEDIVALAVITDADKDLVPDLMNIVFDYMNSTPLYGPTLFSNLSKPYKAQANLAAFYLVNGDKIKADELVDANQAILSIVVEITDRRGYRTKGTLVQLAAMYGSFNIHETHVPYKDYGLVERWSRHLSFTEASIQFEAVEPLPWSAERMQVVKDTITDFLTEISNAPTASVSELKVNLAANVNKFKRQFAPDPNRVITCGYIFDPAVLLVAFELLKAYIDNYDALRPGKDEFINIRIKENVVKSNLFCTWGLGFLQSCASIEDIRILSTGLHEVFVSNLAPNDEIRYITETPASRYYLGEIYHIDNFGGVAVGMGLSWKLNERLQMSVPVNYYLKLCENKSSSLETYKTKSQLLNQEGFSLRHRGFFNHPAGTSSIGESIPFVAENLSKPTNN